MEDICAILCLDIVTNNKIQNIRDSLNKYNVPIKKLNIHITIANFIDIDSNDIIRYSKEFTSRIKPFEITYKSVDILDNNCLVCVPEPSLELIRYYNEYHEHYDEYCDKWTNKKNGLWVPHSTIFSQLRTDYNSMKQEINNTFVPFSGKVVRFELSKINEKSFTIIYSKDL